MSLRMSSRKSLAAIIALGTVASACGALKPCEVDLTGAMPRSNCPDVLLSLRIPAEAKSTYLRITGTCIGQDSGAATADNWCPESAREAAFWEGPSSDGGLRTNPLNEAPSAFSLSKPLDLLFTMNNYYRGKTIAFEVVGLINARDPSLPAPATDAGVTSPSETASINVNLANLKSADPTSDEVSVSLELVVADGGA